MTGQQWSSLGWPSGARQIDWDAIKRDYRTGAFTDQELADKHAVPRETISRRRKKDRAKDENDWAQDQDLALSLRQRLMERIIARQWEKYGSEA